MMHANKGGLRLEAWKKKKKQENGGLRKFVCRASKRMGMRASQGGGRLRESLDGVVRHKAGLFKATMKATMRPSAFARTLFVKRGGPKQFNSLANRDKNCIKSELGL